LKASFVFVIINLQYATHCKPTSHHCYSDELRHISCHHQKVCGSVESEVCL